MSPIVEAETRIKKGLAPQFFRAAFLTVFLLLLPSLALCQNCALCYTQASSSGSRMIEALRSGILILVIPPTLMSVGVVLVAYVKRNQFRRTETDASEDLDSDASDGFPL